MLEEGWYWSRRKGSREIHYPIYVRNCVDINIISLDSVYIRFTDVKDLPIEILPKSQLAESKII